MIRQKLIWQICLFTVLVSQASAQVGKESGLWDWTQTATHHQSIVQVTASGGTGTGVVVHVNKDKPIKDGYEGYCLTAWHVVAEVNDNSIKVVYRNGRRAKGCRVLKTDEETDVALIWAWIPKGIEAAKVANEPIKGGDKLEFTGLGGGSDLQCCLRHFSAVASSPTTLEKIFADVPLLPGDSGGPVFNEKREVVGIISGGWFWWDGGVKMPNGSKIKATWPARASNIDPIRVLMAKFEDGTERY